MLSRSAGYLGRRREGGFLALPATLSLSCAYPLGFQNVSLCKGPWRSVTQSHLIYRWEAEVQRREGKPSGLQHPVFLALTLPLSPAGLDLGPRTRPWVPGPGLGFNCCPSSGLCCSPQTFICQAYPILSWGSHRVCVTSLSMSESKPHEPGPPLLRHKASVGRARALPGRSREARWILESIAPGWSRMS